MRQMKKILFILTLIVPILAFTGCGGDDDEPSVPDQTLNVGQTYNIPADGIWDSANDLIATVNGKTVKGVRVGSVVISNGELSFDVTVTPTVTLFKDPCLDFGANAQTVKNAMKGYEYVGEDDDVITYMDRSNSVAYGYSFKNSKLSMSMVIAPSSIGSTSRVAEHLAERYVPVTSEDDYIGMVSPDKKVLVIVMVKMQSGNPVYVIAFTESTINTKSSSHEFDSLFKKIDNAIPGVTVKGGAVKESLGL